MKSADELLEVERRRALDDLATRTRQVGPDLVEATAVRQRVRSQPLLATGVGALLGVIAGQALYHMFARNESPSSPRPSGRRLMPALVLASLRHLGR